MPLRQDFVRLVHRNLGLAEFFGEAGRLLRRAAPFDGWCWFTTDPATVLPTRHVSDGGLRDEDLPRIAHNEYLEDDVNKMWELAKGPNPVGILGEATEGTPEKSPRYRDLLVPTGFEAEMRAMAVDGPSCWGGVALFREQGQPDFSPEQAAVVASLSGPLAEGIRRALLAESVSLDDTVTEGPGLVLVDGRGKVEAITPAARRWLGEMISPSQFVALPMAVHAVATRARSAGAEQTARLRARTLSGEWLLLHGSVLEGAGGQVAVIIEPARPAEIAPLIVEAYGLTKAERQVTQLVTRGFSTKEIAEALFLSPYTVQDHLKAIFDKVGVRSRRELVAQLFFRHYVPRLQAGAGIGADGWFVEEA